MSGSRRTWLVPALVGIAVFIPSLWNGFAYDDIGIISANPTLQDIENLPLLLRSPYWGTGRGHELGLWRPVTTGYFAVTWFVSQGAPWVYHLVNVLLHAGVTALVAALGAALFTPAAGMIAGLLFAVHPVHVEAVANVVGAGELLAAVPVLIVLLLACTGPRGGKTSPGRLALFGLLFGFAFLAKESAAVLPALIFLIDASRRRLHPGDLPAYLKERFALFGTLGVVAAVVLFMRVKVLGVVAQATPPLGADLLAEIPRIWTVAPVWAEYARLLFFPLRLSPDYSPDVIPVRTLWSVPGVVGAGLVLLLLTLALLVSRGGKERPEAVAPKALPLGLLWFVIAMLPTSNMLVLSGVLLAERALYIPTVGVAIAAGALIAGAARLPRAALVAVVAVPTVLFSARTVTYTPVWESTGTVMQHLMQNVSGSGRGHWVMGDLMLNRGETDLAVREFRRALTLLDGGRRFMGNVGSRLFEVGELEKARILLERVVDEYPDHTESMRILAIIAAQQSDPAGAERWARAALDTGDGDLRLRDFLATVLSEQGRWDEAVGLREEMMQVGGRAEPQLWHLLAVAYAEAGRPADALSALDSIPVSDSVPGAADLRARLLAGDTLSQSP